MSIDLLLQHPQAIAGHHDLMKKHIDRHLFRLNRLIPRLQDHHPSFPLIAQRHDFGEPAPQAEDAQQGPLDLRLRFYFDGHILGKDLIQMRIIFFDLLDAMMNKGNEIIGVANADDHPGPELRMLQPGSNAQCQLIHSMMLNDFTGDLSGPSAIPGRPA